MRVFAAILVLLLWTTAVHAETFYVEDNGILRRIEGDPANVQVSEWQIRLYPLGAAASGPGNWGLITGRSAENVKRQLESSQRFDRQWQNWCKCGPDKYSHLNPLGPIAIVNLTSGKVVREAGRQALDHYETMLLTAIAECLRGIQSGGASNPFKGIGMQTMNYGKVVSHALRRLRERQGDLARGNAVWEDTVSEMRVLEQALDTARSRYLQAMASGGAVPSQISRNGICDGKPMLPGERCCVDKDDPDIFMVCVAGGRCPPMPNMRCDH